MKALIKELSVWALLLSLILAGHTLAFYDEVAQHEINSQSATYMNDNHSEGY